MAPDPLVLFDSGPQTLIQDDQGGVVYRPGWLDAAQAQRWFERLRDQIPWQHQRRMMYEREVDVPRLMAHYRHDDPALHPILKVALRSVEQASGVAFTSLGLNYYRDGQDSVAPHHDRLEDLMPGYPIVLLSLGATRTMRISRQQPPRHRIDIDLQAGSLLTMSYASQLQYLHGIPKQSAALLPRISIAFRVRPRAPASPSPPLPRPAAP